VKQLPANLPLSLLVALAIVFASVPQSFAHWDPDKSGISAQEVAEFHTWFTTQLQEPNAIERKPTPCCGDEEHFGGDGRYVEVRSVGDGRYEVFVNEVGKWVLYPKRVNPDHLNPTGRNVAWLKVYDMPDGMGGTLHQIAWYCLRLAQGT